MEAILVIDDSPVQLELTRSILSKQGYTVLTAASAEEALEVLRSQKPSLVLADIELPGMDGLEFTRVLKGRRETRDIPVWAFTGLSGSEDERRSREAGCDEYVRKPVEPAELVARLRRYLEGRATPGSTEPVGWEIPARELEHLRERFRSEGREQTRLWLVELEGHFQADEAARAVHQWIGTGSMLGYDRISRLASEVQAILMERPLDQTQLRDTLAELASEFGPAEDARGHGSAQS